MSEADFVRKIVANLSSRAVVYAVRTNTGPHGKRGTPDVFACVNGRMLVIEAKLEYNKPTASQLGQLEAWRKSGALACVLTYHPGLNIGRTLDGVIAAVERGDLDYGQYVPT